VKRSIFSLVLLVLAAVAGALASKTVTLDREYRSLLARGDAALAEDHTFVAIEAYSGAIAVRPDSVLAHLRRGESYQRRGDLGQAARDFRAAVAFDHAATRPLEELGDVLYQLGRYPLAADAYSRYLRLDDRSPRVTYKLALTDYVSGDAEAAITLLAQLLRLNDKLADGYYLLGMCRRDKHQDRAAAQAFEKAIALAPSMIPAREELAELYAAAGRRLDELEQLQAIAELDHGRVERHAAIALAQARAGQTDLAVLTLGAALERSPNEPLIYGALGHVWLDIAQGRDDRVALNKALEALSRAASTPAAGSDILTLYGRALMENGQTELAERTLQQATARYPLDPAALVWYATIAERQNHPDVARAALVQYEGLARDDRDFVPRATRIALLSLRLDDPSTAVDWFHKAVDAAPPDLHLLASLAEAELRAGDRQGAQATLDRALEKDPKEPTLAALARRMR
jgi:tetratricopeptide (TPR) repeat protein